MVTTIEGGSILNRIESASGGVWIAVGAPVFLAGCLLAWLGHPHSGVVIRWGGIALLTVFAGRRRTLTPWIFVAMAAGAELGFDAPAFASHLRVFSDTSCGRRLDQPRGSN